MPASRIASFVDVLGLANEDHVPHSVDADAQVALFPTRIGGFDGSLLVRWEKQLPYCQLIHSILVEVPEERVPAIERAIARINHAVALPGFGFDHEHRWIYFRLCLPVEPDGVSADFFRQMLHACVVNAGDFVAPLRDVVFGASPDGVVQAAVEQATKHGSVPPVGSEFQD